MKKILLVNLFLFFSSWLMAGPDDFSISLFLAHHIHYPDSAKKYRITGTVYIKFSVDSTGQVSEISIVKGIKAADEKLQPFADEMGKEAMRAVALLPKLETDPALFKKTSFVIPFKYTLRY